MPKQKPKVLPSKGKPNYETSMSNDLFDEANVIKSNIARWENVGDTYTGVLVERAVRVGSKFNADKVSAVYTLIQDGANDGIPLQVYGKMPVKLMQNGVEQEIHIIAGLENAKLGQYVGVKYTEEKENKGGFATKIVQAFSKGEMRPEVLAKYQASRAGVPDDDSEIMPSVPNEL